MQKNTVMRVAIAGGIMWGAALFLTTLAGVYFHFATDFLQTIESIYPGYSISVVGSVVGAVYGFLDVFIGVYIFWWIYKQVARRI